MGKKLYFSRAQQYEINSLEQCSASVERTVNPWHPVQVQQAERKRALQVKVGNQTITKGKSM